MPLIQEKYSQTRIDAIRRYLQREFDKEKPRDYEVIVDGIKITTRTNDIKEFEDYEQEIKDDTRNISILVYDGPGTNRNTRYSFSFDGSHGTLSGLGEIDQIISQRLSEKDREYELQRLREKLSATEQQLGESEEFAEQLEQRIRDMEQARYTNAVSLGEVASALLSGILQKNAGKIPMGQSLAGLFGGTPAPLPEATPGHPDSVTFEKNAGIEHDEQTNARIALIQRMQQRLNEEQLVAMLSIIDFLSDNPDNISTVIELFQTEK